MMNRTLRIAAVALAQLLVLGAMIAGHAMVLKDGREVVLRTEPVDPTDLFRGDYVILRYANLSALPYNLVEGRVPLERGDRVFVTLAEDDTGWQAAAIYAERPETDAPVMRGRITSISPAPRRRGEDGELQITGPRILHLEYGIESYFVPEGQGRELEDARRDQTLAMLVAIAPSGRSVIKGVLLDGVLVYEEGLF